MPIPTPKKNETRNEFMQRCIIDPVMIKEFKNEKQRLAICSKVYRDGTV